MEILTMSDSMLEANTKKLRTLFLADLQHASRTGLMWEGSLLWGSLRKLAEIFPVDTLLNESVNNLIKLQGDRCPNMLLETLSSRVVTKKTIGSNSKATWRTMKAGVFKAMQNCIDHASYVPTVMDSSRHRWAAPQLLPVAFTPAPQKAIAANVEMQECLQWSAYYNIVWQRLHKKSASDGRQYILCVRECDSPDRHTGRECKDKWFFCADFLSGTGGVHASLF